MAKEKQVLKPLKPLERKAYGSTPHLSGSRVGPGDWHINGGQERILTQKPRDAKDRIIVTEKLDGSCMAAAKISGSIVPLNRAGYHAKDSPHLMQHMFADWVDARFWRMHELLQDGERIVGEWMAQAHGTRYRFASEDELFVCFAIISGEKRLSHDEVRYRLASAGLVGAAVISDGPPITVEEAIARLGPHGRHGALEPVEGAVWACERAGRFDFIAKHVVAGKVDGKYLPVVTGEPDIWNEWPGSPGGHPDQRRSGRGWWSLSRWTPRPPGHP